MANQPNANQQLNANDHLDGSNNLTGLIIEGRRNGENLRRCYTPARIVLLLVLATASFAPRAKAQTVTIAQLAGPWQVDVIGNTGCGHTAMGFAGTLNASGTATGTLTVTSEGCGGPSTSSQTFTINSLNDDGAGTASLTCGQGCGWSFNIQVAGNKWTFNLVDVSNGDGNGLAGTAVAVPQSTQPITVAQLAGPWQITLFGNTGCGQTAMLFTGTLNATGTATGTLAGVSGCIWSPEFGDSSSEQTFQITSLNANGSGTANLSCGSGCGWGFAIQVSGDKQTFNLVDVVNGGTNVLAGTAVAESAPSITLAQLAGPWQVAVIGVTTCGQTSMLFSGTLNSSGTATGTLTEVSGCGTTTSAQTFTITSLNANGSGTAVLDSPCYGGTCPVPFDIQVAPNKQIFNLVGGNSVGELFEAVAGAAVADFARVPDLLGDTVEQATTAVHAVGLLLETSGPSVSQYVQYQEPAAGTPVPVGSTVVVLFYRL